MEHIDKETLNELTQKLEKEKERLEKELASFAHKNDDVAGDWEADYTDVGDDVDENAFEVGEYSNKQALEHDLELRLKEVSEAHARITAGTYGLCKKDKEPLSIERLRANPAARYCTKHAE